SKLVHEISDFVAFFFSSRYRELHCEDILRIESEFDILKPLKTSHHQSGAYQQHQSQSDFRYDKRAAHTPANARRASFAFFECFVEIGFRRLQSRRKAEDDSCEQRDENGKPEDSIVDCGTLNTRYVVGHARYEKSRSPKGEYRPQGASDSRERDAFGEQLANDPQSARTESYTHGDLFLSRCGARKQEIGDVCAGDQQYESDCSEENEQRRSDV